MQQLLSPEKTLKLMDQAFAKISPTFCIEVRDALLGKSRAEIAEKLSVVQIERCTFAEEDDIGYVYFVRRPTSLHFANLAAPVAETIDFFSDLGINLDIDHDGDLFGLEFLARPDLVASLRRAHVL